MMDAMTAGQPPTPFEVHESGKLLHGTKADLEVGDVLTPPNLTDKKFPGYPTRSYDTVEPLAEAQS